MGRRASFLPLSYNRGPWTLTPPPRQCGDTGRWLLTLRYLPKLFLSDVSISKQTNDDKTHTSSVTPDKNHLFISMRFPAAPPTFPQCAIEASTEAGWPPACDIHPASLLKCHCEDDPGL